MPNLSSSNRSQLSYKLEGTYPTNWGSLQGGNGTLLNMTSESLDFSIKTDTSKVIQNTRAVNDLVQVGAGAQGGFGFEATFKEYDPFILAVLQNTWTHYGTSGVSGALPAISSIVTSSGITTITFASATSGSDILTGLAKGQWLGLKPPSGASQTVKDYCASKAWKVSATTAPTSTVLVLDAATPMDTSKIGASMAAGAVISSSRSSNGTTMTSYTLEVQHPDVSLYRQYRGMIPSKMDLKLAVGSIVTGSFEFMGRDMVTPIPTSTGMGTPTASQTYGSANAIRGVFDIIEGGASISVTTYIKSADLSYDNTLRTQEAVGNYGAVGVAAGTLKVGGKVEVYFADATMYNKFLQNTDSSLSIPILDTQGNGYVYTFPRIKYSSAKVNASGLDQDNNLAMEFTALPDTTAGSPTLGKVFVVDRVGAG